MTYQATFSLNDEAFHFLASVATNRSAYINQLLLQEKRRQLEERYMPAIQEALGLVFAGE